MMSLQDIVDDIINRLEPEQIPIEFILEAKITDFNGNEVSITGDDLIEFMKAPFEVASEARIVLDITALRESIVNEVNSVYDEVDRLFALEFPDTNI